MVDQAGSPFAERPKTRRGVYITVMRALTFVVAWWALSALLSRMSPRIGLFRTMAIAAVVAIGLVVIDFFAFGPADPWGDLYHGGPGPLPIRLLVVFGPKLIGLVLLSAPAIAIAQSQYFADRPRQRAAVALAALAFAAAVLLPTVRFARAYEREAVLVASAQQGLILVSTTDLGTARSPASMVALVCRQVLGSWEPGIDDQRHHLTVFVIDGKGSRRVAAAGYGRLLGIVEHQVIARVGRSRSRWTGSAFEPLSDAERRRLEPLIADRLAAPAGWTVQPLRFNGQPKDVEFVVAGVQRRLQIRRDSQTKSLLLSDPAGRPRELWALDERSHRVSARVYAERFQP